MNFVVFVSQTKVQQPSIGEKYFKEQKRSNMKLKKKKGKNGQILKKIQGRNLKKVSLNISHKKKNEKF